jgi:hypothetical protein
VLAIGQPSHAWLSGQLARAWAGQMERREETCLAAEQHDIGMAEWDLRPTLNPETGLPHSFMEMPLDAHLQIWSHAAEKMMRQSAYAALLVSMHGSALYEMRDLDRMEAADAERVRRFLADRRAEQDALLAALGETREAVRRNQRLVWTWDFMSLALCLDWMPTAARDVPLAGGEDDVRIETVHLDHVSLDPWPFAAPELTVRCEGRRLEGPFAQEADMRAALDSAPLEAVEWWLAPGQATD